jgi:hypothetical protein
VLFPKESFIPLLPAWCLSCLSALVWQACVAERPRFGALWARPITPEPAAVAAGSRARLRRSSCRAVRRPATGQQQEQEQMLGARTSMQPRSARSGSSSSRRRRSRAQSVASVPIARVASFSSSSSSSAGSRATAAAAGADDGGEDVDAAAVGALGLEQQPPGTQPCPVGGQRADRARRQLQQQQQQQRRQPSDSSSSSSSARRSVRSVTMWQRSARLG